MRLGLLLVLDLTDKSTGMPHIESNVWNEIYPPINDTDLERYIVVFRVMGNKITPSLTKSMI